MQEGPYGEAESLATARNVSVRGVQDAGILEAPPERSVSSRARSSPKRGT
jgi:hypothetical protein